MAMLCPARCAIWAGAAPAFSQRDRAACRRSWGGGAAGQSGGSRRGPQSLAAGGVPGAAVTAFAKGTAAGAAEQAAVGCGAIAAEVVAEHVDQDGRDGDGPDRSFGSVLEATLLMSGSRAGPRPGGAGCGPGQGQRPPAVAGQVAVGQAQGDCFFGG